MKSAFLYSFIFHGHVFQVFNPGELTGRCISLYCYTACTFLLLALLFQIKQAGVCDGLCHGVRVAVCCGAAVLEVAFLLLAHLARDADAGASVGQSGGEVVDVRGFEVTREAPDVVLSSMWVVHFDVLGVFFAQLLDGQLDVSDERDTEDLHNHGYFDNSSHIFLL